MARIFSTSNMMGQKMLYAKSKLLSQLSSRRVSSDQGAIYKLKSRPSASANCLAPRIIPSDKSIPVALYPSRANPRA